jgi:hypothetical protein
MMTGGTPRRSPSGFLRLTIRPHGRGGRAAHGTLPRRLVSQPDTPETDKVVA